MSFGGRSDLVNDLRTGNFVKKLIWERIKVDDLEVFQVGCCFDLCCEWGH